MSAITTPSAALPAHVERPGDVLLAAGMLGLAFQWLFWGALPGLSFPLFVALVVAAVWWTARRQVLRAARSSVALAILSVLLAGGVAVRAEPLTTAANILVVLGLLAMLVHAFGSDRWLTYGLRDWALAALRLCGHEATGTPRLVMAAHRASASEQPSRLRGVALPLVRGLLLAAPVVAVLAALLASADAVFASRLTDLSLALPQPEEALGRLLLALVVAYAAAGGLWHLSQRSDRRVLGEQPVPRLLGFPEAATVLVSVNVLLAGFVAVQLRYFFGGQEALLAEGLTYAEYARRGFGELLFVAAISLALHLALAGLTRRETSPQRWAFTVLVAVLTGLVLVILVSAFQRLLLYEEAFGFTRLRTVVHVFMVWLGLLVVALLGLQLADRVRMFLLAGLVAVVGFAGTLNVLGVDALIARHNLARATQGAELDAAYLAGLSTDAVPELAGALSELDGPLASQVAGVLGCLRERHETGDWRSFQLADARARSAFDAVPARHRVSCSTSPVSAAR